MCKHILLCQGGVFTEVLAEPAPYERKFPRDTHLPIVEIYNGITILYYILSLNAFNNNNKNKLNIYDQVQESQFVICPN